jgi:hypothetical protein
MADGLNENLSSPAPIFIEGIGQVHARQLSLNGKELKESDDQTNLIR